MTTPSGGAWRPDVERRLLQLVDEALEIPADRRDAWLAERLAGEPALLAEARALLDACVRAEADEGMFATPATQFADALVRAVEADEPAEEARAREAAAAALAGRYAIVRELGRGGHAVVYLARDLRHARDVAVKVIRPAIAAAGLRPRFLREIGIAAQLRHPYVVPLIDSGEAEGVLFYVMPFVAGESLRQRLDRGGALSLSEALAVARDVGEALDAAHAAGIVHRDVKPQNILLDGSHALVTDFGVALALEAAGGERFTELGVAVGTPAYMSPEQAAAHARLDGRSDVYSLGCVVYEMLAAEVPFPGETARSIQAKHLHAPIPDLGILRPGLPAGVPRVLERALAKNPADRFATAGEMVAALERAAAGDAQPVPSTSAPSAASRPGVRRWAIALAAAAVLAAAALGTWRLTAGQRTADAGATPEAATARDQRRIAVLYFDDLSGEERVARIARGLTEDLIDELSRVRALRVISPNGVRPFRDRAVPVDSIARLLGVGTVVGGSLSASGSTVRATVRLLDPISGEQLQSQAFEVKREDVLQLRENVTTQVAAFLRQRLGEVIQLRQSRGETRSLPAWELVSRATDIARDAAAAASDDARDLYLRADSLFAAAAALDPAWVRPVVGRGRVAINLAIVGPGTGESTDAERRAVMAWRRENGMRAVSFADAALRLVPGSAPALALRGFARSWLGTWAGAGADTVLGPAEADLRASLDDRPDDAHSWYALGELLYASSRFNEAAAALTRAYEADAWLQETPQVLSDLFFTSLMLERSDDARRWCIIGVSRHATDPRFEACPFIYLGRTGRTRADLAEGWRLLNAMEGGGSGEIFRLQWGFNRLMLAAIAARAGLSDSARALIDAVRSHARERGGLPYREEEANVRLLLGERDEAARLLGAEITDDPQALARITRTPWFRDLVADRRYAPTFAGADSSRRR